MPGEARVLVDIRTIPGQSHPDIKSKLSVLATKIENQTRTDYEKYDGILNLDRNHDLNVAVEILSDRPCTLTDRNDPVVLAADWATRKISDTEPTYAGVPGATDGTFLNAWKGIPCLVNGPGPRHIPHQKDEYVEIDELVESARVYVVAAHRFLKA
jgi:succinyl-diaminopimelate desuccinylase